MGAYLVIVSPKQGSHTTLCWFVMAPEQVLKGCCQSGDSLAMGQANREWLVSPSILLWMRAVAKRINCHKDNSLCPGVQHVSPVRIPKLKYALNGFRPNSPPDTLKGPKLIIGCRPNCECSMHYNSNTFKTYNSSLVFGNKFNFWYAWNFLL